MFGSVYAAEGSAFHVLMEVARDFSPRVETCAQSHVAGREVTLDLSGLTRLFGDARAIAEELRRTAADRGLRVRVAIAGTRVAARLLVHARAGITIVEPGQEADTLKPLPISLLAHLQNTPSANDPHNPSANAPNSNAPNSNAPNSNAPNSNAPNSNAPNSNVPNSNAPNSNAPSSNVPNVPNVPNDPNDFLSVFSRWGLRTLGDLAALPPDDVAARLGQDGVAWQRLARGEDPRPLIPGVPEERFERALDLEWPIEGLEPLSFVLGRLMEPLSAHLERRDRGAAVLHVQLHLVTREVHERSLQLPAPIRDARTLRTLALLDLESHPPSAAIDRVVVSVDPTPGRVIQFSLLRRPLPSPEQLSTLMARLHALMGEGRCGSAVTVDSWQPGAFGMTTFAPTDPIDRLPAHDVRHQDFDVRHPSAVIRRFRFPVPARVRVDGGVPVRVISDRVGWSGGRVETHAGPWRTSGGWWIEGAGKAGKAGEASGVGRVGDVGQADETAPPSSFRSAHAPESPYSPHSPEAPYPPSWDRDEWDVTLSDGATYRIFRERDTGAWFIEGVVD